MDAQQLIGLTIFPLSLTGIICNLTIFFATYRIRSLSPSFAFLTGSLALVDAILSFMFFAYVAFMIVFDIQFLKDYSYQCGFILMIFYDIEMELHLVITMNRFFAIFTPILYRKMFELPYTKVYATVCIICSIVNLTAYSKIFGCKMYYNDEIWMFYYEESNPMCVTYSWIIDYLKNLGIGIFDVFINIITILKVSATRRQIQNSSQKSKSVAFRKKELDYLKQACVQGCLSLSALGAYYVVPGFFSNLYVIFMLTTFLYGSLPIVDGLAVIIYNSEIRAAAFGTKNSMNTRKVSVSTSSRKISQRMSIITLNNNNML